MKITGIFFLVLVASTSAWPFSFWGSKEKKDEGGEKSDVILNYDAGDHKHIQTGQAGEEVHGIFSVKEADGKIRTTNYKADKDGFKAEINVEDSPKHSEKVTGENKPADEKLTDEKTKESLKKEEEKKESININEDEKKTEKDSIKENDKKDQVKIGHQYGQFVPSNIASSSSNKDQKVQNDASDDNAAVVVQNIDLNSDKPPNSDAVKSPSKNQIYRPLISHGGYFNPQSFYQTNRPNPFVNHPTRFGYSGYPYNKPISSFGMPSSYKQNKPYNGFMTNFPNQKQQYRPLSNNRKKPGAYPFRLKSPLYHRLNKYRQQKPFNPQQVKEKKQQHSYFRPGFRLGNPYFDGSDAFDDEFYFPEEDEDYQDDVEVEDAIVIAKVAEHDDVTGMTEKEEDHFMERLTPKQIEGLYNIYIN